MTNQPGEIWFTEAKAEDGFSEQGLLVDLRLTSLQRGEIVGWIANNWCAEDFFRSELGWVTGNCYSNTQIRSQPYSEPEIILLQ